MSKSENEERLLHEFYKSLGEVDEESQKWKERYENVVKMAHFVSQFIESRCGDDARIRLYGSSAEHLKNYSFEDVGDLDFLLFPGENYVIDESMLEYSPTNPAYVKIKGTGHPLWQSILAEDTEYISALDVKELYPLVDSLLMGLTILPRAYKAMAPLSTQRPINFLVREESDSAAVTCDFSCTTDSRDIISQGLEQLTKLNFENLVSRELEFIPASLFAIMQVDYNPQHARVFDDFLQHFKDSAQSLCSSPTSILQGIPNFARELWSSEELVKLRNQFFNIESGSEKESGSKPEDSSTMAFTKETAPVVAPLDDNETKPPKCKEADRPFSRTTGDFVENENLEHTLDDEGVEGCVGGNSNESSEAEFQVHDRVAQSPIPRKLKNVPVSEEQCEAFMEWIAKEKAEDFFLFLETVKPLEELRSLSCDESEKHTQEFSVDIVPAVQGRGWPKVARNWISRERKWPSPEKIQRIIQEGFHLVVKPLKRSGCPETDFRLSFSHAEYLLSQELNDMQRQCYRALKKYYSLCLRTEPKCLVTYHLKTIFLQTCEKTGAEMWTEENRTACMMELLKNLHNALTEKYLGHFFIKDYNLFDAENIGNPLILELLAEKVKQFMENPLELFHGLTTQAPRRPDNVLDKETTKGDDAESVGKVGLQSSESKGYQNAASRTKESEDSSLRELAVEGSVANTAKDMITLHDSQESRKANLESARFHDLKELYLKTCLELVTMAVENRSMEGLVPLETTLVEGIKEIINTYNINPQLLLAKFENVWSFVYLYMITTSDLPTRSSMLVAMQSPVKAFKNKLSGNGFLGSPRDYSILFPVDGFVNIQRRLKRILDSMKLEPSKQSTTSMDDIPLD